jgi:hypothetical protein
MTKILRKLQKIFASGAANNGQFGSAIVGTKITSSDIETLQNLPAYLQGWDAATIGGQNLPTLEEFQALHYITNYQVAYLMQQGVAEWNTETIYYIGSMINSDGSIYISKTDDNAGNDPASSPSEWRHGLSNLLSTKSGDYEILNDDGLGTIVFDDTSVDRLATLPTPADNTNRILTIKNTSSNKGKVTLVGTIDGISGLTLDFKRAFVQIQSSGVAWEIVSTNLTSPQKTYAPAVTGTNWTTANSWFVTKRDIVGNWFVDFSFDGALSVSSTAPGLSIAGLIWYSGSASRQNISVSSGGVTAGTSVCIGGASNLVTNFSPASTSWRFAGSARLNAKPTFVE